MKKFFLSLFAALGMAFSANAATVSVWSGSYEFNGEGDGWQEVAAEKFVDLKLGDKLVATVSNITNPDGWAQINLAGKDPWTSVPGTNWGDVNIGVNKYEINDDALLASIKSGGLGIQGKYFVLTDISIETEGTEPEPLEPSATVSVWSGNYEFGAEGDGWQEVAAEKFADLKLGDKLVATVSTITNPDSWAQINLAGKDPWTVVPGTNWGEVSVGQNKYEINDEGLLASIKTGGLGIQGKYFVLTDISIESNGTTTIVGPMNNVMQDDAIYSLSGMKVAKPAKGLFIKGNKKYLMR